MGIVILVAKVKDYDKWEPTLLEDSPMLKAAGAKTASILRDLNDPNTIIVTSEWENLEDAKKLIEPNEIRARMDEGGVIGRPEIYYMEEKKVF
jgi:heme-degrading monooxygenase HmoA